MLCTGRGYLITFGIAAFQKLVTARFCDGGHRCSPPKECCAQGCCYLYAPPSAPRATPPATDHVLNLFFINHWYFWCVVLALILAILCACSLWKKRRQLCGWGSPGTHSQSGDSTGSCYAPPQYSRCSSFHHAPPPYTEVTSKPDMYPLVFTCNGDNTKNGSSYLMVQYFRNYIVRPVGSLSATSTVDSLSSSFICTANEANTLVPPPYSRAASPDLPATMAMNNHHHHDYTGLPRSASQHGYSVENHAYRTVPIFSRDDYSATHGANSQMRVSESVNFQTIYLNNSENLNQAVLSQSDQQFRHIVSSNNISNVSVPFNGEPNQNEIQNGSATNNHTHSNSNQTNDNNNQSTTNPYNSTNAIYNSCGSIGGISITVPVDVNNDANYKDLDILRRSLETCCQILQKQQVPCDSFSEESPINVEAARKFEGMRSYVNSNTGSAVSSLANIGSPASPPQATSPTGEVKELLEQIRQLQKDTHSNGFEASSSISQIPSAVATATTTSTNATTQPDKSTINNFNFNQSSSANQSSIRPSSLQHRKDFFTKSSNKARYFPIVNTSNSKSLRSPIGVGYTSIISRGRSRKGFISRSAPTTPGTSLPPCFLDDDSPLLNEQDEDGEHNS